MKGPGKSAEANSYEWKVGMSNSFQLLTSIVKKIGQPPDMRFPWSVLRTRRRPRFSVLLNFMNENFTLTLSDGCTGGVVACDNAHAWNLLCRLFDLRIFEVVLQTHCLRMSRTPLWNFCEWLLVRLLNARQWNSHITLSWFLCVFLQLFKVVLVAPPIAAYDDDCCLVNLSLHSEFSKNLHTHTHLYIPYIYIYTYV